MIVAARAAQIGRTTLFGAGGQIAFAEGSFRADGWVDVASVLFVVSVCCVIVCTIVLLCGARIVAPHRGSRLCPYSAASSNNMSGRRCAQTVSAARLGLECAPILENAAESSAAFRSGAGGGGGHAMAAPPPPLLAIHSRAPPSSGHEVVRCLGNLLAAIAEPPSLDIPPAMVAGMDHFVTISQATETDTSKISEGFFGRCGNFPGLPRSSWPPCTMSAGRH